MKCQISIYSIYILYILYHSHKKRKDSLEAWAVLTLIWVREVGDNFNTPPPPFWFSLNNSETVKAVTLTFCIIQ